MPQQSGPGAEESPDPQAPPRSTEVGEGPSEELLAEQMAIASRRQRRDVRRLPALVASAVRLVWQTNPWSTFATIGFQLSGAAVAAVQVLLGGYAVRVLLQGGLTQVSNRLIAVLVLLALVTLIGGVAAGAASQFGRLLGLQVERRVTDEVLDVSTRVSLVTYDEPVFHDHLKRVLTTMPTQPYEVVTSVASLIGGVGGVVALLVTLVTVSPVLALALMLLAPPLWFLARRGGSMEFEFAVSQTENTRERFYLADLLTRREGAAEARAYATADVLRRRFGLLFDSYISKSRSLVRRRYAVSVLSAVVTAIVATGAVALLVLLIRTGQVDVAQASSAIVAIRLVTGRVSQVFAGVGSLFQSSLFLDDFESFRSRRDLVASVRAVGGEGSARGGADGVPTDERPADIEFRGVSFSYPEAQTPALSDVDLTIPAGQIVAVVGENGSGKSTFARLVAGLYEPTKGAVRWTTADGTHLDQTSARDRSTLVLQDFARYQFSAQTNVGLGRPSDEPDLERVRAAAGLAGVDDLFDGLPQGYDTRLSRQFTGGRELSAGQWQRVALARAFYRRGSVVILDEPSASLDPRAEHRLYESVRTMMTGCTVILITHRLRSVRGADRIVVFDKGRVIEDGDHESLWKQRGLYRELSTLQDNGMGLSSSNHANQA